jgi:hypothetical protein
MRPFQLKTANQVKSLEKIGRDEVQRTVREMLAECEHIEFPIFHRSHLNQSCSSHTLLRLYRQLDCEFRIERFLVWLVQFDSNNNTSWMCVTPSTLFRNQKSKGERYSRWNVEHTHIHTFPFTKVLHFISMGYSILVRISCRSIYRIHAFVKDNTDKKETRRQKTEDKEIHKTQRHTRHQRESECKRTHTHVCHATQSDIWKEAGMLVGGERHANLGGGGRTLLLLWYLYFIPCGYMTAAFVF